MYLNYYILLYTYTSDECMDTDMQTPSDTLAFQLRQVIQEKDQEIQKKDENKLKNLRLWYSN